MPQVQQNTLTQQQPINWQMNEPTVKPTIVESTLDELKEKIVDSEKSFIDQLIRPQEMPVEKSEEKPVEESKEKSGAEYESDESAAEWNADNQEDDQEEDGVEKLVAKQDQVMNAFAAHQTGHQIDSSYVFIELGEK